LGESGSAGEQNSGGTEQQTSDGKRYVLHEVLEPNECYAAVPERSS
jgi:hypothetical protein